MLAKDSNFKEDDRVFPHYKCYYFMPHTNKTSLWYQLTLALGIGSLGSSGVQYQYGVLEGSIYTEEKAKIVAAAWGTKLLQFLATLTTLYQDDLKNRMKSSYSSNRPGANPPILPIVQVQNSSAARN